MYPVTLKNANASLILRQRQLLVAGIGRWVGSGGSYALLDFPWHSNVGDSAIWLGESHILKELTGRPPRYVCSLRDYDEAMLKSVHPDGPIFLSGGGNFGDLWNKHQEFREHLIDTFKDRVFVQLPQSVHFGNSGSESRFARLVRNRGKFVIMVRDQKSHDYVCDRFDAEVVLTPDAAVGLGTMTVKGKPRFDYVMLLRSDKEAACGGYHEITSLPGSVAGDWLEERGGFVNRARLTGVTNAFAAMQVSGLGIRRAVYEQLAAARVARGVQYLRRGRVVLTDRLHGHILALLAGIPNVVMDNRHGKVHAYARTWNRAARGIRIANSPHDALVGCKDLLAKL